MRMAPALIEAAAGRFDVLIAERGYYRNAIRAVARVNGTVMVVPSTRSRKAPIPYDCNPDRAYKLVERLWYRFKDWWGVATRCDKLAINKIVGVFLATITFWF
ncbi:hypothetical protein [uncultured Sphingomonas sp.]|uniref:hypothetical protein n=1 Tax=uncultured Sphingomonas sp. TaxID=158754 RepID=UPI0025D4FCA7|nr:hypothetical protein [uncultured Sphingomonas sp.]